MLYMVTTPELSRARDALAFSSTAKTFWVAPVWYRSYLRPSIHAFKKYCAAIGQSMKVWNSSNSTHVS